METLKLRTSKGRGFPEPSIESQLKSLTEVNERYSRLNNGSGHWAVVDKETARIVGAIILKQLPDKKRLPTEDSEVSWHLRKASWGQGYATEAGRGMLNYGFNVLHLPVLYAVVKAEFSASICVTQRLGMKPIMVGSNCCSN